MKACFQIFMEELFKTVQNGNKLNSHRAMYTKTCYVIFI